MAIEKMKKLRLLVSRTDKDDVLRELMLLGCVEVSEPDEMLEDPEFAELVGREDAELERRRAEHAALTRSMEILNKYVPVKTGMFAARPDVTEELLLSESDTSICLELSKTLVTLDDNVRRLTAEETNEKNLIEALTPWAGLDLSLDSEGTSTTSVMLGAVAATVDLDAMRGDIASAVDEADMFTVSSNKEQHYLCIVCLRQKQSALAEVLRRYSFALTTLRHLPGTAGEQIAKAEARLVELASEKADLIAQITAAAEYREALQLCFDHIWTKIERAEAGEKLLGTRYSVVLTGWATARSEPQLAEMLGKYSCAWEFTDPTPEEYEKVPVLLNNSAVTRPLTMVTEMYSLPAYDGVDPNPPMMPFFVLFYGLMMADIGYGLIMMIAAIIVKRKKPRGGMRNFFDLLLLCGISTFVVGILTGGFFGDAPEQIAGLFGAKFSMPALFDPLNNTMEVLIGALALGVIHVFFGMGISFKKQIKDGHVLDAIFDIGSWWILFIGIALGALNVTWWVAIVGVAMIVLTGGRSKPNIIGKLASGLGSLYNITGYFGDILSYSRIMALMLAGGVIAQVFNKLGVLTGNIVTFLIIFALGHALNFGLNLLGCFVHDMRLQCLEFFGKFYQDGGKPFHPLSVKTKYNNVISK
ncbi:MAG: V-type ATP synthase subunit I [Oscillospiraceae bacterium]|nr:V-type ATP synthase subunit I [Oscillospiraceae bacterium]